MGSVAAPMVSVIIPVYNRKEYIQETLDSVLSQSFQNLEVIVVDDGSTDGTLDILKSYGKRIKLFRQKHAGRGVARNLGIKKSQGKYLAFLDSDDVWLKHKLKLQVEILEKKSHIVCVYGACLRIDQWGAPLRKAKRQSKGYSGDVFYKLLFRNFVASPTPLIRRSCFENGVLFFERFYNIYEDWDCWLQLALCGHFYFISKPLAHYRIHAKQSVQLIKAKGIELSTLEVLDKAFDAVVVPKKIKSKAMSLAQIRIAYWYLCNAEIHIAKDRLKAARKNWPRSFFNLHWFVLRLFSIFPFLTKRIKLSYFYNNL